MTQRLKILLLIIMISFFNNNVSADYEKLAYDFKFNDLDGSPLNLSEYKGKVIIMVNVASQCGFTKQYEDMQKIWQTYQEKGVVMLGVPSNDFGTQEPGTAKEIASFCSLNYGVSFPMMEKVHVKGNNIHPVYDWLTDKELNGWNSTKPSWNFCKYLISEEGELLKFYRSGVKPMSSELTTDIIQPPLLKK